MAWHKRKYDSEGIIIWINEDRQEQINLQPSVGVARQKGKWELILFSDLRGPELTRGQVLMRGDSKEKLRKAAIYYMGTGKTRR